MKNLIPIVSKILLYLLEKYLPDNDEEIISQAIDIVKNITELLNQLQQDVNNNSVG